MKRPVIFLIICVLFVALLVGAALLIRKQIAPPPLSSPLAPTPPSTPITIAPATATLVCGAQQKFTATPATGVTWMAAGGTIISRGVFTAGAKAGTYTVTATAGVQTATATVSVTAPPPLSHHPPIGAAQWPMAGHDARHTGRSPYVGPATSKQKWVFVADDAIDSSPAIGADGTVYAGTADGSLYGVNPDGTKKWEFVTDGKVCSPTIGADGTIYSGSDKLYALNPDGTQRWAFTTGSGVGSLTIGAIGTVYANADKLYAVNPDGTQRWASANEGDGAPAIAPDGTIYSGTDQLVAFKPDGTQRWTFTPPGSTVISAPAVGADGTIYVVSADGISYAMNPDGTQKWAFTAGEGDAPSEPRTTEGDAPSEPSSGSSLESSTTIGADGTIYVGSDNASGNGVLYAIKPNGKLLWKFTGNEKVNSEMLSTPIIDANGTLYVGCESAGIAPPESKKLYAVNRDGTQRWAFNTEGVEGTPAIGANGILYVGTDDGKLYAIGP